MWLGIVAHIPKSGRYTIGLRIENSFLDLLELSYIAYFSEKDDKQARVSECILGLDKLKFLISIAWEAKLVSGRHYEAIALKLDEVGKMLGGWRKSLDSPEKKNRTQ